jgi:hypothetical protein
VSTGDAAEHIEPNLGFRGSIELEIVRVQPDREADLLDRFRLNLVSHSRVLRMAATA